MRPIQFLQLLRRVTFLVLLIPFVVSLVIQPETVSANHTMKPVGMICSENASATFTLTTKTGEITLPDGNVVYMWGFSEGEGAFQHPSPILCVNEGDTVTIVVRNTLPQPVSLIFPGQQNVLADGQPSQPVVNAGELLSLAPMAQPGGAVSYSFVAANPGTYIYESGTNPAIQINMGLFGAIVVRPAMTGADPHTGAAYGYAYNDERTAFDPNTEFLLLMSEVDPFLHQAIEQGQAFDMRNYRARYWLYNGRSFPDTIADNGVNWLPNQPFGSLTLIRPLDANYYRADGVTVNPGYNPKPALVRYLSVGNETYPHHPHGNHGRVIARDGHLLVGAGAEDLSFEKFLININPGQTWDVLFDWNDVDHYTPDTNPIPVPIPQLQNLTFGTFYSGSPYLGQKDLLPVGTQALNACGEYYHIAHNHALQQITAWGVVMSGQITFTRVNPPEGCTPNP